MKSLNVRHGSATGDTINLWKKQWKMKYKHFKSPNLWEMESFAAFAMLVFVKEIKDEKRKNFFWSLYSLYTDMISLNGGAQVPPGPRLREGYAVYI